jgi:TRAP-type transport system small permease protein
LAKKSGSLIGRVLVIVGSAGLLGAIAVDGIAVIGRHAGVPLIGSIEMSEAFVVLLAASSIAVATLDRAHAAVDLLHSRLSPAGQLWMSRFAALAGALFAAALIAGSIWVAADLWSGNEKTELLGIPLAPLRIFWIACALVAAVGFLIEAVSPGEGKAHSAE